MIEKIPVTEAETLKDSKCEDIFEYCIDDVELYLSIFKELPKDSSNIDSIDIEYSQKDSLIVIADPDAFFGRRLAEDILDEENFEDDDSLGLAVGILNRGMIEYLSDFYGIDDLIIPPAVDGTAVVLVASDSFMCFKVEL